MDREKIPETQPHYWIQGLSPFVQRLGTVPSAGAAEVSAGAFEDATVVPAPGRPEFFGGRCEELIPAAATAQTETSTRHRAGATAVHGARST